MNSYNFFQDLLDTYQSFGPFIQLAWLVVPCATIALIFWLYFRYRLKLQAEASQQPNPPDLHPYLWEDQRTGRVVAYHAPIPDAPTLMALLDCCNDPSGRKE